MRKCSTRVAACLAALAVVTIALLPGLTKQESLSGGLYGDPCSSASDCNFQDSVCDEIIKICACHPSVPVSNYVDKCGKAASINETCMFNAQCEESNFKTECKNGRCMCKFEMVPEVTKDGAVDCSPHKIAEEVFKSSAVGLTGVLVDLAIKYVVICGALRLFIVSTDRYHKKLSYSF